MKKYERKRDIEKNLIKMKRKTILKKDKNKVK